MRFNIGDLVRSKSTIHPLVKGDIYTVYEVSLDGKHILLKEEMNARYTIWYHVTLFELATTASTPIPSIPSYQGSLAGYNSRYIKSVMGK